MGYDKIFQRKKSAKKAEEIERKQSNRKPYKRVLISCEGTKTEPNYIRALMHHMKITTFEICDHKGTDPISVVNSALNDLKEDSDFEGIFCIFDRDQHLLHKYNGAIAKLDEAERKRGYQKKKFMAVTSVPCFELWFLLHFEPYTRPTRNADGLISVLKKKKGFERYKKGDEVHFDLLIDRLDDAKKNAEIIYKQAVAAGTDNPTTKMHEFVRYLETIVLKSELKPRK